MRVRYMIRVAAGAGLGLAAAASAALAAEQYATGEQIRGALADNTVEGFMEGSNYSGFYGKDGSYLNANRKTGRWSIMDDKICFGAKACYALKIEGMRVTWFKDGMNVGGGVITKGNPHSY